ncbi:MAG: cytochrome b/b6 domain-containing protein [Magnetococcales bacterium]|nr:cytochrome b/b6 domain-containing protein [Magnetococcales bacterium]MBF0148432.1 cytochrome b/b6 domain-containing protein [Magnetococcales bacterium]MBF0173057.1 cytochrome b/b6 domain-containing protein [Magnetococcales bacterium]MBF0631712.1 cytochrome b/b6 domain-containing protein [Magnetococcales bacterium]
MNTAREITVWDPWVRLFHWSLVVMVLAALVTEDEQLKLHVLAGHGVIGLVIFRLIWGFMGTEHALFTDFVRKPAQVIAYLRAIRDGSPGHHLGHNPAGGMMIVVLLGVLFLLGITGLLTIGIEKDAGVLAGMVANIPIPVGKAMEEFHEALGEFMWVLIGLHLTGVVLGIWQHRENLIWSMITGRKRSGK